MSQLLIEMDSEEDEALLMQLLPRLSGRLVEKRNTAQTQFKRDSLKGVFAKLTQSGVAQKYGDPSDWQREIRSWDRLLDGLQG
ncbi:hypothetical protein [Spirosoma radiotolerans]|uniref:Uncharacterized protein n=1 Tax=Spirosoma radiotolerans TaxID=1379870 RepID=A0A0E3ZWK2_9BACT|nr:hypothetical protein [Spirosoma radiotolerans]AKD55758.1 hypothetical protein SD10_13455 [Spirosoma radiotolerans]